MKTFSNFTDAENFKILSISEQVLKFCPLSTVTCRMDCVCFIIPPVADIDETENAAESGDKYRVYEAHCGNEMFFKEEYNCNCRPA